MAGLVFDYFDGYLRVEFRNGRWQGDIEIIFYISGDTVATTPCDDEFQKGEPEIDVAEDGVLCCWTSSSECHFFLDMKNWLEAITCGVAECAFNWCGEGPDGELRWRGRFDSGTLRMEWTGRHDSPDFERRVRLNKAQMVRAFYHSFREFVESDRYDPLSYERLNYGEVFDLLVTDGREAFVRELALRDRSEAYALVETILRIAYRYDEEFPRRASLAEFALIAESFWEKNSYDANEAKKQMDYSFGEAWDHWSAKQRRHYVEEKLCSFYGLDGQGENLRDLRSPLVESWLASQPQVSEAHSPMPEIRS